MALIDVIMPQMGESIAEGTISKWHKKAGEKINKDETLLEISTDKVDSEIPSPATGIVAETLYPEQTTVNVHTVIARIQTDATVMMTPAGSLPPSKKVDERGQAPSSSDKTNEQPLSPPEKVKEAADGRFYSPLVLNIARTEGIPLNELDSIQGTGNNNRVTKKDVLTYVEHRQSRPSTVTSGSSTGVGKQLSQSGMVEVIKMDTMRKAIAEHMVRSKHTSAHVGSVSEADVSAIVRYREEQKASFEKREGYKLTYTPFFIEAVVKALKDYPLLNSSVEGDTILVKKEINVGVAVALENGLIVPVIKNADAKNLIGMARAIHDLATRARTKKLSPEEVIGGTFTVTNPGSFGNLYGFPIINQPQVAILGVGAIQKRAIVIDDAIAIRSMVYLSMSYDHRIIDGMLGGLFIQRIVAYLQNFDTSISL